LPLCPFAKGIFGGSQALFSARERSASQRNYICSETEDLRRCLRTGNNRYNAPHR
jgi:hypothetical protein